MKMSDFKNDREQIRKGNWDNDMFYATLVMWSLFFIGILDLIK